MADRQVQSEILDKSGGFIPTDAKATSPSNQSGSRPGSTPSSSGRSPQKDGKESVSGLNQKDREERIRALRERQSEERQRKLEDLKLAALHAQKVREQQEEDRRRKIEELKIRDQERRAMVEERKKQIWEAEKERREAILRKNTERDARIEARRNANRSSIGFAFGSSTPRLLDENGYFNNRRSASQTNVMLISTNGSRQSSEREMDSNKRRASSSFRLDHKAGDAGEDLMTKSLSALMGPPIRGRRKTDLTPTLPLHDSPRTHSPGRALSMTRLDLLAQPRRPVIQSREHLRQKRVVNTTTNPLNRNKTKSMLHLASSRVHQQDLEKPSLYSSRSASKSMSHLFGTDVRGGAQSSKVENNQPNKLQAQSMWHLTPAIVPRLTRAIQLRTTALLNAKRQGVSKSMMQLSKKRNDDESSENSFTAARTTPSSPSRPNSSMSQQSLSSHASQSSTVSMRNRNASHRPRPVSIAGTPTEKSPSAEERQGRSIERKNLSAHKTPPRAKSVGADQVTGDTNLSVVKPPSGVHKRMSTKSALAKTTPPSVTQKEKPKIPPKPISKTPPKQNAAKSPSTELPEDSPRSTDSEEILEASNDSGLGIALNTAETEQVQTKNSDTIENTLINSNVIVPTDTEEAIAPSKPRITTEEEAKAALAERRRLAREQFEREAELERLRQEELKRQEEERIRQEEEERRRWEEEQDRLRQIEAQRLQKAIEEQKMKEEEEQKQKEEENRLKQEKEEAERKSREEQERLRKETEERLRKEEEERAERRKRVEAIMSRTRGKGTNNTPVTTPTKGSDGIIGKFDEAKIGPQQEKIQSEKLSTVEDSIDSDHAKDTKSEIIEQNIPKEQHSSIVENIGHQSSQEDKEDNTNTLNQSFSENKNIDLIQFHSNGFAENEEAKDTTKEFMVDNKSSEKKVSGSNLIDSFEEFETLKAKTPSETTQESVEFDQYIDLNISNNSNLNTEDFINNADNVNSNVPTNGPGAPFIAFEDNFTKKQETNVTDLL